MSWTTEAGSSDHRVTGWSGLRRRLLLWSTPELVCPTDLASDGEIDPDLLMVPNGNQPPGVQTEALAGQRRVHADEAFPAYRRERSG